LHIVHILNRFSITASALDQIKLSLRDGHKISLIIGKSDNINLNKDFKNLNLIELKGDFFSFDSYKELLNIIKNIHPDIIHTHHGKSGFVATLVGKKLKIPTLIEDGAQRDNYTLPSRILFTLTEILSDKVVFVSKAVQNSLSWIEKLLINQKKCKVIYYGVDTPKVNDEEKKRIKNKFNIKENEKIITHTGRMVPVKQQDKIIEIFSKMLKKDNHLKLLIVGDGPLKEKLFKQVKNLKIENNVIFTGLVQREEVYSILSISDYFIMLSKTEGHSVSLLEAMSYGAIPILSKIESFQETISDNLAVFVDENNYNIDEIFKKLNQIQKDEVKEFYNNRYSEKIMMEEYYNFYRNY